MAFEARFDLSEVNWTHMVGGPEFDGHRVDVRKPPHGGLGVVPIEVVCA